jgi:deoxyribose-phosphate aldolase
METKDLWRCIDHTLLKPTAAWRDVRALCAEAVEHGAASVCIPPVFVSRARAAFPSLNICTVIGFPLGFHTTRAKTSEAMYAVVDGADEIDMVVNLTDVKLRRYMSVTTEIATMKSMLEDKVLKVIIETCYLKEAEKIALCHCATDGGADYVKTSTGFGSAGAQLADIPLIAANIGPGMKIKAAGGISTRTEAEAFINAGCSRIGTSRAMQMLA